MLNHVLTIYPTACSLVIGVFTCVRLLHLSSRVSYNNILHHDDSVHHMLRSFFYLINNINVLTPTLNMSLAASKKWWALRYSSTASKFLFFSRRCKAYLDKSGFISFMLWVRASSTALFHWRRDIHDRQSWWESEYQ